MTPTTPVLRWILAVLASAWFLPVSCTGTMAIGSEILAGLDARDAARGESVHGSIAVAALPLAEPGRKFRHLLPLHAGKDKGRYPEGSFLMPDPEGRLEADGATVTYKVVAANAGEQTIETNYRDGDRTAWGRYRATRREITPLASRLSFSDYMFSAMPWGLGVALLVYLVAGYARRRLLRSAGGPA